MATGADSDRFGVQVWDDLTRPEVIVTGNVDLVVENSPDGRASAMPKAGSGVLNKGAPTVTREGNLIRIDGPTSIVSTSSVHLSLPPDARLTRPRSDDSLADLREGGSTTVFGDLAGINVKTSGNVTVHGSVGQAAVAANSDGYVRIANVETDAAITAFGPVELRRVAGECAVATRYGNLAVGWVGGDLTTATESGRTKVDAVRGTATLSSTRGGDISVGSVNPRFAHTLTSTGTTTIEHRSRHRVQNDPGRQAPGAGSRPTQSDLARSATLAAAMGNEESGLATWVRDNPDNTPTSRRPVAFDTAQIVLAGSPGLGAGVGNRPERTLDAGGGPAAASVVLPPSLLPPAFGAAALDAYRQFRGAASSTARPDGIDAARLALASLVLPEARGSGNSVSLSESPGPTAEVTPTQDYRYSERHPRNGSTTASSTPDGVDPQGPASGRNKGPQDGKGGRKV